MSAGSHEVSFNAVNLASGVYIYRLNVQNNFVDTKKNDPYEIIFHFFPGVRKMHIVSYND